MTDPDIIIGAVIGVMVTIILTVVLVEVNQEVISNDVLDEVCKSLARDERAEYKNAGFIKESEANPQFHCVIPKTISEPIREGVIVIER